MELDHISQPQRYFVVIAKGNEVLDWKEMSTTLMKSFGFELGVINFKAGNAIDQILNGEALCLYFYYRKG